jgi:hypothetical protein
MALMIRFPIEFGLGRRRRSPLRVCRRLALEVTPLEDRALRAFLVTAATVTPSVLWPPDGRFEAVTLSGVFTQYALVTSHGKTQTVIGALPGPRSAAFQVTDEYRRDEPRGPLNLIDAGNGQFDYSTTIYLQASRANQFTAGRRYYIAVAAHDRDAWSGTTLAVVVPHDLSHPSKPQAALPATATPGPAHPLDAPRTLPRRPA